MLVSCCSVSLLHNSARAEGRKVTKHEQRKEKEKGLYCLMGGLQESARCPWQTREDFSSARQGVEFEGEGTMTYCKLIGGMLAHPRKAGSSVFRFGRRWK